MGREQARRTGLGAKMHKVLRVDLPKLDRRAGLRQGVVCRTGEAERIRGNLGLREVGRAAGAARNGKIQAPLRDHRGQSFCHIVI